jgi:CRP/FNR family cyclic AMP-dependent transcriptional regulator
MCPQIESDKAMDPEIRKIIDELKDEANLFHLFNQEELGQIGPYLEVIHLPAGAVFFKEGDPGNCLGIVISGRLQAKKQTEFHNNQLVLALLGRGSLVGELAMIDEDTRSASVVAVEDSDVVVLRRAALDAMLQAHPYIGIKLYKGICRILSIRLRTLSQRLSVIF